MSTNRACARIEFSAGNGSPQRTGIRYDLRKRDFNKFKQNKNYDFPNEKYREMRGTTWKWIMWGFDRSFRNEGSNNFNQNFEGS